MEKPPSLENIFKELQSDLGCDVPRSGNLTKWARQGVLMMNTSLTVRAHRANSHSKCGWAWFTDSVIQLISEKKEHVVFILWGGNARSKKPLIDTDKHLILECAHPSPLSAFNGFFRLPPFFQNQRLSERAWYRADRLGFDKIKKARNFEEPQRLDTLGAFREYKNKTQ